MRQRSGFQVASNRKAAAAAKIARPGRAVSAQGCRRKADAGLASLWERTSGSRRLWIGKHLGGAGGSWQHPTSLRE